MVRAAALALALALLGPAPALACRLALVLAIDVSSSVDAREDRLQRGGLAAALRDPEVGAAFLASPRPVALYAFEWSGRYDQAPLLPGWQMIRSAADLEAAARAIETSPRSRTDMPTAIGYALGHASILIAEGPVCDFATIDVAGDGINNEGFGPAEAYAAFPFEGITVNGLVVSGADYEGEVDLIPFFRNEVIRGPGAFIEIANGYEDYARAMTRKLLAELAVRVIGAAEPPAQPGRPG